MTSESYAGTIAIFSGDYIPRGWAACDGQKLPIYFYRVLYGVIGTTYGGDGKTFFNLPNLNGRLPRGCNNKRDLGTQGGSEDVPFTLENLPDHNHKMVFSVQKGTSNEPKNHYITLTPSRNPSPLYAPYEEANCVQMDNYSINASIQPSSFIHCLPPVLGVKFCICIDGSYSHRP